ncbi:MAG: reverse transcriptase domain-containing protein [Desulfurellaceae bacterium]|nr:reverse transcriptase domain-containing protein [Desulfurellaceae bacterium]
MNKLWNELLKVKILKRGWHIARLDTKQDFAEDLFSTDIYGLDLDLRISETINRLSTDTYQPRPLLRMDVPKGTLGFRPGAVIPIQDRAVVSAIVFVMAEEVDKQLPDSVYSWRLKKPAPKSGSIFQETDIADIPFLKKSTIRKQIDPFESWYEVWPDFDKQSRETFLDEKYRYLATSDIAAYFENIQLPILRDQLLQLFPEESRIVNLLFSFLESWAPRTSDGRTHLRGIPQGNAVSSFLGNLFLLPLDLIFKDFEAKRDIRYFRYMDDVRIFSQRIEDARLAIFTMDRELRRLHLNVQTAKTKILDQRRGEISHTLIDERVEEISDILEEIEQKWHSKEIPDRERDKYLKRLNSIAHRQDGPKQKILGSRGPLEGLSTRVFLRWINVHCSLKSDLFVRRLLHEIEQNSDYRITRKLLRATRLFPRRPGIERAVIHFLKSDKNIFPHQEAECLRALRYLSRIQEDTISHCKSRLFDENQDPYVRMQASYLIARTEISLSMLTQIEELFDREKNPYIQVSLSMILVQKRSDNSETIRKFLLHPNEKVSDIGKLYQSTKDDIAIANAHLNHMFREETLWLLCDNMPFVHVMAASEDRAIRERLLNAIRTPRLSHPVVGIRDILRKVFTRTRESLNT